MTWAHDQQADRWMVTLNGIPLGFTDKSSVQITDIERQRDNIFAVYGVTAEGEVSEKGKVILRGESFIYRSAGASGVSQGTLAGLSRDDTSAAGFAVSPDVSCLFFQTSVTQNPTQTDVLRSIALPVSRTKEPRVDTMNLIVLLSLICLAIFGGVAICHKMYNTK